MKEQFNNNIAGYSDWAGFEDPANLSGYSSVAPVILAHFYKGAAGYDSICESCSQPRNHHSHFRNRGVVCDNASGPCACGTTHTQKNP